MSIFLPLLMRSLIADSTPPQKVCDPLLSFNCQQQFPCTLMFVVYGHPLNLKLSFFLKDKIRFMHAGLESRIQINYLLPTLLFLQMMPLVQSYQCIGVLKGDDQWLLDNEESRPPLPILKGLQQDWRSSMPPNRVKRQIEW